MDHKEKILILVIRRKRHYCVAHISYLCVSNAAPFVNVYRAPHSVVNPGQEDNLITITRGIHRIMYAPKAHSVRHSFILQYQYCTVSMVISHLRNIKRLNAN